MSQSKLPIEFSYRVAENFIAGEYPFERTTRDGIVKLKCLTDFGITHFIDLTSEQLTPYRDFLPKHCTYLNLPTPDLTIPSFEDLKTIHELIKSSTDVFYVHCLGGFDRTAVAVATYFIFEGKTVAAAKKLYFQKAAKQRLRYYPRLSMLESQWNVLKDYKQYLKQCPENSRASADIKWIAEPDKRLGGIECPYCKKESLGLYAMKMHAGKKTDKTTFQMQCFNAGCVTNYRAASASEMSVVVKRALGIPLSQ
jgi:protein-tyrosine phosphatase